MRVTRSPGINSGHKVASSACLSSSESRRHFMNNIAELLDFRLTVARLVKYLSPPSDATASYSASRSEVSSHVHVVPHHFPRTSHRVYARRIARGHRHHLGAD